MALPIIFGAIPFGLLIDRYSRARLLFLFAISNVIGSLLTAAVTEFHTLLIARSLVGLTSTTTQVAACSMLSDLCPPSRRGRATMAIAVGQYAGVSAAFALGGLLLRYLPSGASSWRTAMYVLAIPMTLAALAILAMREPARLGVQISRPAIGDVGKELWRYKRVIVPLVLALTAAEMGVGSVFVWAGPSLARSFGLTPDHIGEIMALAMIVTGVLGPVAGGSLADACHRLGGPRKTVLALGTLALISAPLGLFAQTPSATIASSLLVVFLITVSAALVAGNTLFTIVIPNELRGLCISILGSVTTLFSSGVAPVAISLLSEQLGGSTMIGKSLSLVCGGMCLISAACFALSARCIDRPALEGKDEPHTRSMHREHA